MFHIGGSRRGYRGSGPPENHKKYRVSLQYWSRSPEKASIQLAIIGLRAIRHLNGVLLDGPMMAHLWRYLDPPSPCQLNKNTLTKFDPSEKTILDPRMLDTYLTRTVGLFVC